MSAHTEAERVRVRYRGPTETVGSRLIVLWRGTRRALPFNHAARDAFAWAASQVVGVDEDRLRRLYGGRRSSPDVHVYEISRDHGSPA